MKKNIIKRLNDGDFNIKLELLEFFNASPDLIFIHDNKGNLIEINENLKKILGYANIKRDLKNSLKQIMILNKKKTNESFYLSFFKKITKKSSYFEYTLKTIKGKMLYLEGYSIPISNNCFNSPIFLHIAHNIVEKKKIQKKLIDTQKELKNITTMIPEVRLWSLSQKKKSLNLIQKSGQVLKESEDNYRTILKNMQEGYFEIDLDGHLIFFNRALCEIVGYSYEELLGMHYRKLMDPNSAKLIKSTLNDFLPKKDIQIQIIKKNNEKVYIETSLSDKYNSKGEKIGFFGISRNISERKKAERIESKFRENLENEVKIRTQELIEAFESQKLYLNEILKASNFKTVFLSTMSHELRTPLNAIIGFSDILIEESYGKLTLDQKDFLYDINISAEHLLEMISNIMNLSKIEAGELELKFRYVDLNQVINQTLSVIKPLYREKNLEFEIKRINEEIKIIVDHTRLKEILFNLLSNAIKYTRIGKVTLEVIENNNEWVFNIIDTGIGIEKKDYHIIFKEFKRVQSKFVSSVSGSGLGLALTKRLVKLHGGKIYFKSKFGEGSTFTFTIPKNLAISNQI